MKATLSTLAEHFNVSKSLISKVLNDKMGTSRINPTLAQEIFAYAEEVGYRPNPTASALATMSHGTVGVLIHYLGEPGSGLNEQFLIGASAALNRRHQKMWLNIFSDSSYGRTLCELALSEGVDGLVVAGVSHPDMLESLKALQDEGIPVVTAADRTFGEGVTNVMCSHERIMEEATRHVLGQGCRRLLEIGPMKRRGNAFAQVAAAGAERQRSIRTHNFSYACARKAIEEELANSADWPWDGIVAQSDHLALGAMHTLLARGIRVPDDVKIIGVDNSPACENAPITLSSICQDMVMQGETTIETLFTLMKNKAVAPEILVEPKVVGRESTGASR